MAASEVFVTGDCGVDSVSLDDVGLPVGVAAVDNEGDGVGDTPRANCLLLCSDFCFLSNLSASISALLCSRCAKLPVLVEAPVGNAENHDINRGHIPRD